MIYLSTTTNATSKTVNTSDSNQTIVPQQQQNQYTPTQQQQNQYYYPHQQQQQQQQQNFNQFSFQQQQQPPSQPQIPLPQLPTGDYTAGIPPLPSSQAHQYRAPGGVGQNPTHPTLNINQTYQYQYQPPQQRQ